MDRQIIKLIPDFSNTNVLATSAFQVIISITKRTQLISNFFSCNYLKMRNLREFGRFDLAGHWVFLLNDK